MPRVLILDADGQNITLVVATTGRGGSRVEQVHSWAEAAPLSIANADAIGRGLRDRLTNWKLSGLPLIVGVGRDRVVLKEIKFPAVPAHEEPAVVRFQAVKELTDGIDELVLDYHPHESTSSSERKALVVAIKKDVFRISQLIAQTAGLKLLGVVPKVYGLAAAAKLTQPPPSPGEAVAIMALGATGGEFVVSRDGHVLFARPVPSQALTSDQTLLSEVRRNLTVYSGQAVNAPVKALYIAEGPTTTGIIERIRDTVAVPLHALKMSVPGEFAPGLIAAPVGLANLAAGTFPINFVKPREPKPPVDPHRRPLMMSAGLAATLLVGLGLVAWMQVSSRDKTISRLREELNDLTTQQAALEPDGKRYDEVKKWLDNEVPWLDELYDLTARMPDLNKLRLVQVQADPLPTPAAVAPGKKVYAGRVTVKGLATEDAKPLTQFMSELVKEGHYRVDPKVVGPNTLGTERRSFSQQFSTRYDIEKRSASTYSRVFTAEVPTKRARNRGMGGMDLLNFFGGGQP